MITKKLMGWLDPQRLVISALRVRPNSDFIVFRGQRLTRRQVYSRVTALAAGLRALGVTKGDKVATLLPGSPEAVYAALLPSLLGNVNVPLNPLLGEQALRHILGDCSAKAILVREDWYGQDYPALLARLLPHLPALEHVIVCDGQDKGGQRYLRLQDVMSEGTSVKPARVHRDAVVLISYTSGTTGRPKGVVHTKSRYWGLAVRSVNPRLNMRLLRCLLLPFPPYHYAGLLGVVATLLAGGRVVLMDRFDPQRVFEYVEGERASQIAGSPTMYRWLLQLPGQERFDLSSLQRVTLSTEPCPLDLAEALHDRMGCHLENMYGATESMVISWTGPQDSWETVGTTVGRPVPGAEVRVVDDERRPVAAGQTGEIAVRTSQMMSGYHGDPALTAQVLDAGGWFYTGDLGKMDHHGYVQLVDRKKDLIIRGGENVYPAEVERHLEQHPFIRRAGVIGVPSKLSGESVWAYLELQPGAALSAKEVLNMCRGQIAPFKIPEKVCFVDHLPTTATDKVQKHVLREMAAQETTIHVEA